MGLYTPLHPKRNEIRVLTIEDGLVTDAEFPEARISVKMATVSLDDRRQPDSGSPNNTASFTCTEAIEDVAESVYNQSSMMSSSVSSASPPSLRFKWGDYETLSYTWGSNTHPRQIILNGEDHQVQENLYQALDQFRITSRHRSGMTLWADAICINQKDDEEKKVQVPRMGHIFRTAVRSIIWLGQSLGPLLPDTVSIREYFDVLNDTLPQISYLDDELDGSYDGRSMYDYETDYSSSIGDGESIEGCARSEVILGSPMGDFGAGTNEGSIAGSTRSEAFPRPSFGNPGTSANNGPTRSSSWPAPLTRIRADSSSASSSTSSSSNWEEDTRPLREDRASLIAAIKLFLVRLGLTTTSLRGEHDVDDSFSSVLPALLYPLFSAPYWSRMWIIQELVLSSRDSVIYVGSAKLHLEQILGISSCLGRSDNLLLHQASDPRLSSFSTIMMRASYLLSKINGGAFNDNDSYSPMGINWVPIGSSSNNRLWVYQALSSRVTIPADKLYGMFGLLGPTARECLTVDYKRSIRQICIDTTLAYWRDSSTLWSLGLRPCRSFGSTDLPSWAIDVRRDYCPNDIDALGIFKADRKLASKEFFARQSLESDDGILFLRGTFIDAVDGVAAYSSSPRPPFATQTNGEICVLPPMSNPTTESHSYSSDLKMLEDLNKILHKMVGLKEPKIFDIPIIPGADESTNQASDAGETLTHPAAVFAGLRRFLADNNDFRLWQRHLHSYFPSYDGSNDYISSLTTTHTTSPPLPNAVWSTSAKDVAVLDRALWVFESTRLATTRTGKLGVVSPTVASGDHIFCIEGHGALAVLRPVGDAYEFAGLSYMPSLEKGRRIKICREDGVFEDILKLR